MQFRNFCTRYMILAVAGIVASLLGAPLTFGQEGAKKTSAELSLRLRSQVRTELNLKNHQYQFKNQKWRPRETAIIICDFWDYHHCLNAVRRMKEFGPRLNEVVNQTRKLGVTVIHSPSDCMDAYKDHPARKRVLELSDMEAPEFAGGWCSQIPGEELAEYPIDQSDGGEDDDPAEHQMWAKQLKELGRNPNMPWKKQNDMVPIDVDSDFVSDRGDEVWKVLKSRGIKNVILAGVHTNMCVLGRPFGLRQMKRFGFNVVLLRDMTDSMYNPKRWPFVSHFAGHDRVIAHVEKYVCPTISSDQLIGGEEFSFESDSRPHLAIVIGESEYKTEQTLPAFAMKYLPDLRLTFVTANPDDRNDFPDARKVSSADAMLISVRRRVLKPEQMQVFRQFESSGKPILGIRTASHAFSLRKSGPPKGYVDWKSFDSSVFGGSYTNHYGNKMKSRVTYTKSALKHPITAELANDKSAAYSGEKVNLKTFGQGGSLYKTSPLAEGSLVLLNGAVLAHPSEPAAWTFTRVNGGRSFYTSLGHPEDFLHPEFQALLRNAIYWAVGKKVATPNAKKGKRHWRVKNSISLPEPNSLLKYEYESNEKLEGLHAKVAFRKVVFVPRSWVFLKNFRIRASEPIERIWLNGRELAIEHDEAGRYFKLDIKHKECGEANWLTVGAKYYEEANSAKKASVVIEVNNGTRKLNGDWEWISAGADFEAESKMYLPAKFGGNPRIFRDLNE